MSESPRRFTGRRDIWVVLALVAAALLAMWALDALGSKEGNIAVVTLRGQEIMRFNLRDYAQKTERVSLVDSYGVPVHFELKDGTIRFVDVDCPDHLCEAVGPIRGEYESAACLPNETLVAVYSPEDVPFIP